jgi:iron complex outermembrane receptor protein
VVAVTAAPLSVLSTSMFVDEEYSPMNARRRFLFSFLLSLITTGAGTTWAQSNGTVRGRVVGPTGDALSGASISVTGTQRGTVARTDGSYQFNLPAGRYELRARLIGYAERSDSVTVTGGTTTTKNFRVERLATSLESVAILGTRGEQRSVISAPVPIDVLSAADLGQTGRTETAQMLQAIAPSFNFPRATIADGTDHIRPATLRGLSPDQALILVNGKRRHTSALVNLNGFVGRGAQAVDLNSIPASMIDHIEILRDGAAAQYGSDAIAGVINIVLKSDAPGSYSVEAGQNITTYNRGANAQIAFPGQTAERSVHDGDVFTTSLNNGWSFGQNGYFQAGGELRNRAGTNRSLPDTRPQYFTGDPRNANAPAMHFWQGDSYNRDGQILLNAGETLGNGVEVYAFGGYGRRRGASAGMWRRANDDRTVRSIYPDGFLPFIKSDIADGSFSAGLKGDASGWGWDLGTVYGRNAFAFSIDNSANVSLGNASKTSFDAGELAFAQSTTTLDLHRDVRAPWHRPLRVALGGEFRADQYDITAGEPDSYRDGGVRVLDASGAPTTRLAAAGAQVFPGFRPGDAGSHSRNNAAAYVDLESDLTSRLLLDLAGRAERYSDFGSTSTGKAAGRFNLTKAFALRGAVSTGFRAPSLGQEFFSSTATNFISGVPFDIRTFPVDTKEARLLGARDLEPERSVNVSAGLAIEPASGLAFTADFYRIKINKRIVLSDNFTGAAIQTLFTNAGLTGVSGGRFFSNAIDTRSNGVDLVANYDVNVGARSVLRLTSGYNHNAVKVTRVDSTPPELRTFQENLFGRVERTRIERGNPRDNFFVSGNYTLGAFAATARTQRYGEVSIAGASATNATGTLDQTFGAKWITDLGFSYTMRSRYSLTVGADNLFDVYPDRNLNPGDPQTTNGGISNFGIFPYNGISPFGFNGRFVYTKLSLGL